MYNNEQTFIIRVCILQSCLLTVSQAHGSLPWKKLAVFRDVGAGLWYCSPHLMHLAIAMFADHPSGQSDLKVNIHDFKHNLCFLVMHNSSYLALSNVKYLDKLPLKWLPWCILCYWAHILIWNFFLSSFWVALIKEPLSHLPNVILNLSVCFCKIYWDS